MAPFMLSVYLGRNRRPTSLKVTGINSYPTAANLAHVTDWTPAFLSSFAAVTTLKEIDIHNLLFPSPLAVVSVLRLMPKFYDLETFRFLPWIPASLGSHYFMPKLSDLTAVTHNNPALQNLSIPIDAQSFYAPCPSVASSHALQFLSLWLFPNASLSSIHLQYTLHIATFIHTLFPFVRSLTHDHARNSVQWFDWAPIEMVLGAYRGVYTRAIRDAQRYSDTALSTNVA